MPTTLKRAATAAVLAAALLGAGTGTASAGGDCFNHPDACEAPGATDHAPALEHTVSTTADVTTCFLVWCF